MTGVHVLIPLARDSDCEAFANGPICIMDWWKLVPVFRAVGACAPGYVFSRIPKRNRSHEQDIRSDLR